LRLAIQASCRTTRIAAVGDGLFGGDASEKQRCGNVFSTAGFALRDAQAPWPHVALHGGLQPGVLQFSVFVRFCFSSAFRVWMNVRGIFDPESMICVAHLSADCFGCRTFSVSASTPI
jgi:hypothetical protein